MTLRERAVRPRERAVTPRARAVTPRKAPPHGNEPSESVSKVSGTAPQKVPPYCGDPRRRLLPLVVDDASRAAATFGTPLARWVGARFVLPATMR